MQILPQDLPLLVPRSWLWWMIFTANEEEKEKLSVHWFPSNTLSGLTAQPAPIHLKRRLNWRWISGHAGSPKHGFPQSLTLCLWVHFKRPPDFLQLKRNCVHNLQDGVFTSSVTEADQQSYLCYQSVPSIKQIIISRRETIKGGSFGGCKVQFFTQDVLLNIDLALFSVICCNYSEFEPFVLTTLSLSVFLNPVNKSKWLVSYSLSGTSAGLREGIQCASLYETGWCDALSPARRRCKPACASRPLW